MPRNQGYKVAVGVLSTLLVASTIAGVSAAWGRGSTNAGSIQRVDTNLAEHETGDDAHGSIRARIDATVATLERIDKRIDAIDGKLGDLYVLIVSRLPPHPP